MNEMKYTLEKSLWTQDDFKVMGWHDCSIYAIQLADDILIDIDYILKWVLNEKEQSYQFWVAPATLQFISPCDLEIAVKLDFVNGLEIADIHQTFLGDGMYEYHIETQEGDIRFKSKGYKQLIRKAPVLQASQCMTESDRDGYPLRIKESSN
jgi:hypothetical protein